MGRRGKIGSLSCIITALRARLLSESGDRG